MFYLRGLLVSISVFTLLYVASAIVVCCFWRAARSHVPGMAPSPAANFLYAVRMSPVALALLVVFGLSIPSFLRFEPRGTKESLGVLPILLTAVFVVFASVSGRRAWRAYRHTQDSIRSWTLRATPLDARVGVACFQTGSDAPPVALAGVSRPTLVISAAASNALTPLELSCTLEHELAHWRSRDNLKKLLLHACGFPGMASLERAWLDAMEYSADSAAVHSQAEALDLASALVKISRLSGGAGVPELASGLVDGPSSLLEVRIQRLIKWPADQGRPESLSLAIIGGTLVAVILLIVGYPTLFHAAHAMTELLVH